MLISEAGIAAQPINNNQSRKKIPKTTPSLGRSSLAAKRAVEQAQPGVGLIPLEPVGWLGLWAGWKHPVALPSEGLAKSGFYLL